MMYLKFSSLVKDSYIGIWNPTKHEIDAKLFRTYTVRNLSLFCSEVNDDCQCNIIMTDWDFFHHRRFSKWLSIDGTEPQLSITLFLNNVC